MSLVISGNDEWHPNLLGYLQCVVLDGDTESQLC